MTDTARKVIEKPEHPWNKTLTGWITVKWECDSHERAKEKADELTKDGRGIWIVSNTGTPGVVAYRDTKDYWPERENERPRTDEQVQELRRRMLPIINKHGHEKFTCDDCHFWGAKEYCPWIFDAYNTNGDCLAVK